MMPLIYGIYIFLQIVLSVLNIVDFIKRNYRCH